MPEYITTRQAAEQIGVTPACIWKYIHDKRLPAIKVGRDWLIKPEDLKRIAYRPNGRPRKDK